MMSDFSYLTKHMVNDAENNLKTILLLVFQAIEIEVLQNTLYLQIIILLSLIINKVTRFKLIKKTMIACDHKCSNFQKLTFT